MPKKIESPEGYSWCGRCREHKELYEFSRNSALPRGVYAYCKECRLAYDKEYLRLNKVRIRRTLWSLRRKYRQIVFEHYSGTPPRCQCPACPNQVIDPIFLDVDHINGLSTEEREHVKIHGRRKRGGMQMWRWLIENNFPSGFQILCSCCNQAKNRNHGICPHMQNMIPRFDVIKPEEELKWSQSGIAC